MRVAVAGSTGSIGTQTLDIVRSRPDDLVVTGLSAGRSADAVAAQVAEFAPSTVVMADPDAARALQAVVGPATTVVVGDGSELVDDADVVINGVVGFAGLPVTMAALQAGKRLGLANKESLIAAGPVVAPLRQIPGAEIVPVDSEHCALFQCLRSTVANPVDLADPKPSVRSLVLTASGGPFRGRTHDQLAAVTIDDALAHPTWSMGPKITVDSSTLMNKGLEVIEAQELFGIGVDRIEVVVHPQSIVHSMVSFVDGSSVAQLSRPDMRLCIAYAIDYPDRRPPGWGTIDWSQPQTLTFEPPDRDAFPALDLAYAAARTGQTAPAILSAANEIAVGAFLDGRIGWTDIVTVAMSTLDSTPVPKADSIDAVLDADRAGRETAARVVGELEGTR